MTVSKKQATNSKVSNSKAVFKTGKNEQAESLMKCSFEPLFSSKDNKARLTFCGAEHSLIKWTKDGIDHEQPKLKLVFSCFDVTHESPANIAITCNYRLSKKSQLGQILTIMGYEFKDETVIVDSEDEYGSKTKRNNPKEIFDFLRSQCGLVYKANLTVATRKNKTTGEYVPRPGLWDIDYSTLEPKLNKESVQERDMMASDVSDEDFENPDIAMASESD